MVSTGLITQVGRHHFVNLYRVCEEPRDLTQQRSTGCAKNLTHHKARLF